MAFKIADIMKRIGIAAMLAMAGVAGFSQAFAAESNVALNVSPGNPLTALGNNGTYTYTYNAGMGVGTFALDGDPTTTTFPPKTFVSLAPFDPSGSKYVTINIQLDASGNVVGGVAGAPDFVFWGSSDVDGDGAYDYTGELLTGEIVSFGFIDTGTVTDRFDFRFQVTGGLLQSYFAGQDLGVVLTPENSTFVGIFDANFQGDFVKGSFGPIPSICVDIEKQISVDEGATWLDADSADTAAYAQVGSVVEYRLAVSNCGSVDLIDVQVSDDYLPSGAAGSPVSYTIGNLPVANDASNPVVVNKGQAAWLEITDPYADQVRIWVGDLTVSYTHLTLPTN